MVKRFFAFLVAAVLLCGLGVLFFWNPGTVEFRLTPSRTYTLPLPLLLLLAFLAGAALVFLLALFREAQWTFAERRRRTIERRRERRRNVIAEGRRALGAGRADRARGLLRRASDDEDIDSVLALAEASLAARRPEEALTLLDRAKLRFPAEPRVFELLGRGHERLGDRPAATAALEQAVSLDPENPRLAAALRDAYVAERRWPEAVRTEETVISLLRHADEIAREQSRIRGYRLEAALVGDDEEATVRALRLLVSWDPAFLPFSVTLGDRLHRLGRRSEAARVWARAAARRIDPALVERLERLYRDLDRPKRMIDLYRRWLRRADEPRIRLHLARFLLTLGRADEAQAELDALDATARRHPAAQALGGEVHRVRGNAESALHAFRNAAEAAIELDLPYECLACGRTHASWHPRCEPCGAWDSLRPSPIPTTRA